MPQHPRVTQPTRVRTQRSVITIRPAPTPDQMAGMRSDLRAYRRARRKFLTRLMRDRGMNMSQLARATAIDLSYISRIISGARMPGLDTTMRLARALGIGLEELAQVLIPNLDLVVQHTGPQAGADSDGEDS